MEEDKELQEIKKKKLEAMMKEKEAKPETKSSGTPVKVTDHNFGETVKNNSVVVIDCWAAWCLPCRMLAPIIGELAKEYAGRVLFGKLNVDENRQVAMDNNIMGIPTLLVFKNGELVDRIVGVKPKKALEAQISQYLQH